LGSQFIVRADTLGLSAKSTRQLERMIDDAAWVTYPLHLLVGIVKTFLFILLLIGAVMLYTGEWMFTAHDDRADLIQNFNREQTIYRVNTANATVSMHKAGEFDVDKDTFNAVFTGYDGTDSSLKHTTWFDHNWLAEKSDAFQGSYIMASRNIAALRSTLGHMKAGQDIASFHYACLDAVIYGQGIVIPNAPVVYIAFLRRTDRELESTSECALQPFHGHVPRVGQLHGQGLPAAQRQYLRGCAVPSSDTESGCCVEGVGRNGHSRVLDCHGSRERHLRQG
jgi:hypothetical protein